MNLRTQPVLLAMIAALSAAGCSSNSDEPSDATGPVGGAVMGPTNDRCEGRPAGEADPAACLVPETDNGDSAGDGGDGGDGGVGGAGGATDCNQTHDADYGDTLYNSSGDDDDCKYVVSWTSTPVRKGQGVTFTVTASSKATGEPLVHIPDQSAGALPLSRVEPYIPCDPTHFAPGEDFDAKIAQTSPGVFTVGPILFDKSGRWAVRFHFYESCLDSETSPHGHAAFFVDVP